MRLDHTYASWIETIRRKAPNAVTRLSAYDNDWLRLRSLHWSRIGPALKASTTIFLFANLRGSRALVAAAMALTLVAVASDILMAFPLKLILDKIINHIDPNIPVVGTVITAFDRFGSREGLNAGELHTQLGVIFFAGAALLTLGVLSALVSFAQLAIASYVAHDLGARLRNRLFVHVSHLPLEWHGRQRVGDVVQRITANITDIEKFVADGLVDLLSGVLLIVGALAVMLLMNWQFTLVSMIIAPAMAVVIVYYTQRIKRASKRASRGNSELAEVATESIGAIAELKAFTLENWLARSFGERVERRRQAAWNAGRLQAEFSPIVITLVAVSSLAIITIGAWVAAGRGHSFQVGFLTIAAGSLTVGSLTVFLSYSKQLYQPMRNLAKLTLVGSNAASAAERLRQILDEPWEESSSAAFDSESDAGRMLLVSGSVAAPSRSRPWRRRRDPSDVRGNVVYQGVTFGYEAGRPVLHGIDLEVPVGKRVALVGLSGSGKTTLVRLLPRFYDPWEGTISIDGVDIRAYPREVLRRNIGVVLQDSVLFEGTIRENIVLDRPDAARSEIIAAARQACIHETIMRTPQGYNSHVREHGKNFSSGQRQRITIARAILRDAPILILDEPTANLDVEAEADVMEAIEGLTAGRTVIVISHRLSTLGRVDEIAVLSGGRIVERGTYRELKLRGGVFAHMLAEQNRYAAEPVRLPIPGLAKPGSDRPATQSPKPAASQRARHNQPVTKVRGARPPYVLQQPRKQRRRAARLPVDSPQPPQPSPEPVPVDEPRPEVERVLVGWACRAPGCTYVVAGSIQEVKAGRAQHLREVHGPLSLAESKVLRASTRGSEP